MGQSKVVKNSLPLVLTSMAVITALAFILGLFMGNQVPGTVNLTADSLSSWLSAIATVAIAVLTFILAKETWYLREAQNEQLAELRRENIRPDVGIELASSPVGMSFMNVKITNFGKGIAKKITFEFLDRNDNLIKPESDPIVKVFQKLAMFRLGIQSMGIKQEIRSFIFSFYDLQKDLGNDIFTPYVNIRIKFEDVEGNEYVNAFVVDFAQYEGLSELGGGDALYQASVELKKIREQLAKVTDTSNRRIGVDVFTSSDRQEEEAATRKWLDEQRQARL